MGKVHSLFGMSGKIGDYVFYELTGQQIMRKKTKKKKPKVQSMRGLVKYIADKFCAPLEVLRIICNAVSEIETYNIWRKKV